MPRYPLVFFSSHLSLLSILCRSSFCCFVLFPSLRSTAYQEKEIFIECRAIFYGAGRYEARGQERILARFIQRWKWKTMFVRLISPSPWYLTSRRHVFAADKDALKANTRSSAIFHRLNDRFRSASTLLTIVEERIEVRNVGWITAVARVSAEII